MSKSLRRTQAEISSLEFPRLSFRHDAILFYHRMKTILHEATDQLGCDAAALYLIDPKETFLQLEAMWGLPAERFSDPTRPLRYARADLSALLGGSVAFTETRRRPASSSESESPFVLSWNSPEPEYPSSICARVSTATQTLGTLWVFSREIREFTDTERFLWEQVASRVGVELENYTMRSRSRQESQPLDFVRNLAGRRKMQFPPGGPFLDDWDFSGSLSLRGNLINGCGGDWFSGECGIVVTVSETQDVDPNAVFQALDLRMVLRSIGPESYSMEELLRRAHQTLWMASAGEMAFSLVAGVLHPDDGTFRYATAGEAGIYRITESKVLEQAETSGFLASTVEPETSYPERELVTEPGEAILIVSQIPKWNGLREPFKRALISGLSEGARGVLSAAKEFLVTEIENWRERPHTMAVIRRRER
ncbi:MAG: SpoIIE family protein phosphatase [Planctomycetia bacterium]|nr:SpoIIE family protein phosphatase [Planctomycetia bacterium]